MGRKLCILGVAGQAREQAQLYELEGRDDLEIWGVNEAHKTAPKGLRIDRVFQLHVRDWREAERRYLYSNGDRLPDDRDADCFGRNNEHVEYLRTCGVPVYGQVVWPDIPTSTVYPFGRVEEAVGIALPPKGIKRLWATSSFGYMAALALTEHLAGDTIDELLLYAIELPLGTQRERLWEWPNFAYYCGLAAGLGIKLTLPSTGSSILSAPHYALQGHPFPNEADHWLFPGYPEIVDDGEVLHLGTWRPKVEFIEEPDAVVV